MKLISFLLTLAIAMPTMAQVNRNGGDRVSNLGNISAATKSDAIAQCNAKGGNLLVHHGGGTYTCYYYEGIKR